MRGISSLEIKVGILIVAGIAAVFALVLISDRLHFERYYQISAYLADAGGLRNASPVTLSGIRIGEVEQLSTTHDPRGAIRVTLKINQRYSIPAEATLAIGSSGIFGDSYLAFTARGAVSERFLPADGSAEVVAGKGFIENASQQAERILAGASELLAPDMRAEIKRLITNSADLAASGTALAKHLDEQSKQVGETLLAVKALAESVKSSTETLSNRVADGAVAYTVLAQSIHEQVAVIGPRVSQTLERIDGLAKRGDDTLAVNAEAVHQAITGMAELSQRMNRIALALESGQGVAGKLLMDKNLSRDLDSASVDFAHTAALLAEHPEALLFGVESDEAKKAAAARNRDKQRRFLVSPASGIRLDESRGVSSGSSVAPR